MCGTTYIYVLRRQRVNKKSINYVTYNFGLRITLIYRKFIANLLTKVIT